MNTIRLVSIISLGLVIGLAAAASEERAAIMLIVHNDVKVETIKRSIVSEIYMGTRTKWDDGEKIRVVMLKEGDVHEQFVQTSLETTTAKHKNHWKKLVFTGTGEPPKICKTEKEVVEFVAENEGAIGYISEKTEHDAVKVVPIK